MLGRVFFDQIVIDILNQAQDDIWFIKSGDYLIKFNTKQELINFLLKIEDCWDDFMRLEFFNLNKQLMYFEFDIPNYLRYNF